MPYSCALVDELEVPSNSCVKARMAPPGSPLVTPAIVSLGQLGDPTKPASSATTTRSTSEMTGYFQKQWRTMRSGGLSVFSIGVDCVLSLGCEECSSCAMILLLLVL